MEGEKRNLEVMVWPEPTKMWTFDFEKYVHMYNVITKATTKKGIQRDTVRNVTDKSKCHSKTCSSNSQKNLSKRT